jgi:WD40 repeat protein
VITASADATARLWDATTGATLQVFEGHESPVVFAGTVGDYVATGSIDRTIRLWRKGLSSPLAQYNGHLANVELVALTRNGSQIISASHDGEVHLWDYSEDHRAMLGIAKRIAPRCLSRQQRERFGVPETALDWCKQPAQN